MPAADTWMTVCALDGLYGPHLMPIPFHPELFGQGSSSSSPSRPSSPALSKNAGPSMRTIGGTATLISATPNPPIVGNHRTGQVDRRTYEWDRPLTPSLTHHNESFNTSTTHPASVGRSPDSSPALDCADVSACHPASLYFRPKLAVVATPGHRASSSTNKTLASYTPLIPSKPKQWLDTATTHPASVSSSRGKGKLKDASLEDRSNPAITHPASSAFVTVIAVFDPSTTHPASIAPAGDLVSISQDTASDSSCIRPASQAFVVKHFDSSTCHPASVGTMSVQQQPHPPADCTRHQQSLKATFASYSPSSIHPASVSTKLPPASGPSEVRHVHPASPSFVTFNAATTHPASVWRPGQVLDMGDASVSHPGWIGFGAAKPQKSRL